MAGKDSSYLLDIYKANESQWETLLRSIINRITERLATKHLKFTHKFRVKALESLYAKKQGRYKDRQVRDLLGIRLIVPFLEDVETVVSIINDLFTVIEVERKSDALSYREFAYDSVHLEISLDDYDATLPHDCALCCEIQVRTTLQDAWAEVEHEILYKSSVDFPDDQSIRKKMAALNANLSLSDMIFQEIRDKQKELEVWGQSRFQELRKRAKHIDPDSVKVDLTGRFEDDALQEDTRDAVEAPFLEALSAHNDANYQRAIDYYCKAINAGPDLNIRAIIYNHRGLAFFMLGQEQLALADFAQSHNCDPTYYQALNNQALVLRRMGLVEDAIQSFSASLELKENQPDVYFLRAQTFVEVGDYDAGRKDAEKALELTPAHAQANDLLRKISNKT